MSGFKPCPFCGYKDTLQERNEHGWPIVRCSACGACGPCTNHKPENAVTAWNRRHEITPHAGEAVAWRSVDNTGDYIYSASDTIGGEPLYTAPPRPVCDGNHAAPACADPECWQRPSAVAPVWQPISTAPRDGTRVDIWYDGERYTDCIWLPVRHCFVFDDSDGMRQRIDGTHWMPLPEPPSPPDSPGSRAT